MSLETQNNQVSVPKMYFRTIIKELPDELLKSEIHRTYAYNDNNEAYYLQPTVPIIVNLEIISDDKYKKLIGQERDFILSTKWFEEGIKRESRYKAGEKVKTIYESVLYKNTANEIKVVDYCPLVSDVDDVTINKMWEILKDAKYVNLSSEEAKRKRFPEAKRRFLLNFLLNENAKEEIVNAWVEVAFLQQLAKINAKAKRIIDMKYISVKDKRLYNKKYYIGKNEHDEAELKGRQLFLVENLEQVLKNTLKLSRAKLDKIDYSDVAVDDYAQDYADAIKLKNALTAKLVLDEDEELELEDAVKEIEHLYAKQVAFERDNTFSAVMKINDNEIELPPEVFATEYDYCQYVASCNTELADLNEVLKNPENFFGINDRSPIYLSYEENQEEPKLIFDFDIKAFNVIVKKRMSQRKREKRNQK